MQKVYAIADLHLSLKNPKPMDIFGKNWVNHAEKIKQNWINKVSNEDIVLIPGDFSWETYLEDTYEDFKFLDSLPGRKILLKGNHDYWWSTLTKIKKYLKDNNFNTVDILFNNSFELENYIVAGNRGWDYTNIEDRKIIQREINRLEISLKSTELIDNKKPIIVCTHYPPISKNYINNEFEKKIIEILNRYNVKICLYGHLHSSSHTQAITGERENIQFNLVSADYLNFELFEIV